MDTLYNKMYARDFIISSDISELDADVMFGETIGIDAELNLRIIRKNKMKGRVRTLKMVPDSVEIKTNIQDTYVREELQYMSFKDSTVIKSGVLNNENFFGMLRFDKLDEAVVTSGSQFLTLKLVVTPVDGNSGNIYLHELDKQFKAYNVSYINHPQISEDLGVMSYNSFKNEYSIDITQYAKQIISGTRTHNGFTFTSDNIVNICSNESHYGQPKLVLEYIDPNKFQSENEIPAEIEFLETSALLVELDLANPYPVLDTELIFSKDGLDSRVVFAEYVTLDAEVTLNPTIKEIGLDSSTIFSKENIDAEVSLDMSVLLLSEVGYRPPDEVEILSELNFGLSSYRPALVNLAFPGNSEIDAELKCYTWSTEILDVEVELKNQSGSQIDAIVSLYVESSIDAEVEIIFAKVESEILAELEFTKTLMPAYVRFSPSDILNSEFEMMFSSELDSEVTYVLFEHVDAEVKLYTETNLDSEFKLALPDTSNIEAAVIFDNSVKLDAEVSLYTQIPLNVEFKLLFESKMDAEVKLYTESNLDAIVSLYTESSIDAQMQLHLVGMSSVISEVEMRESNTLNVEVTLEKPGEIWIDACVITYAKNELNAEMVLIFVEETNLNSVVSLYVQSPLNSELVFKKQMEAFLDSSVKLNIVADIYIDAECNFIQQLRAKILIISN